MTIENKPIPKELVDNISIQYLAEYWVISIRAHIDYVGIDRSIDLMRRYMKHSGVSFGLRFQNSRPDGAKNIEKIATSVEYCSRMLHMEGGRMSRRAISRERPSPTAHSKTHQQRCASSSRHSAMAYARQSILITNSSMTE